MLREPLESGRILISRAARQAEFPADFQLIAAMNPCKCGYADDPARACPGCTPALAARYRRRVSGPLRDRIDIQIQVSGLPRNELLDGLVTPAEDSATVRARVLSAWQRQIHRQGQPNGRLDSGVLQEYCTLPTGGRQLMSDAIDKLGLSARGLHRVLRIARTIADLDASDLIAMHHLTEAIGYRRWERG